MTPHLLRKPLVGLLLTLLLGLAACDQQAISEL